MAISLVQTKTNGSNSGGTTLALTWASNTTTGNLIIVAVSTQLATVGTPTDSQGNTYTLINSGQVTWNTGSSDFNLYYAKNITGGAGSVTVNMSGTTGFAVNAAAREYAGLDTTAPLDQVAKATDGGAQATSVSSGATPTTTQASELVVGAVTENGGGVITVGAGFSNLSTAGTSGTYKIGLEDLIVSSTGAQTATFTLTAGNSWASQAVTFKAAAGTSFIAPPPKIIRQAVNRSNTY
jgi:hypothetical protein